MWAAEHIQILFKIAFAGYAEIFSHQLSMLRAKELL